VRNKDLNLRRGIYGFIFLPHHGMPRALQEVIFFDNIA
jgi:hypothetical protein